MHNEHYDVFIEHTMHNEHYDVFIEHTMHNPFQSRTHPAYEQ